MQNNKFDPRPTVSILLAIAFIFAAGGKMVESLSEPTRMYIAYSLLLASALIMLWYFIDTIRARKKKTDYNKSANKQISINIGINSGDFTDDKMSTKRMKDFHKLVKSISSGSDDHDKQSGTKDTSRG